MQGGFSVQELDHIWYLIPSFCGINQERLAALLSKHVLWLYAEYHCPRLIRICFIQVIMSNHSISTMQIFLSWETIF